MRTNDVLKLSGLCGLLVPVLAISSILMAVSYAPWFRWDYHCLSDLGVSGKPAMIFNNGLIIAGILSVVYGIFLMGILPKTKLSMVGVLIFILASVALVGVGLFPETTGDAHLISSISFFTLAAIAILIIGIALVKTSKRLSAFLIVIAFLVPTAFFIPWPGKSCAIAEVIGFIPVIAFSIIFSGHMLLNKKIRS